MLLRKNVYDACLEILDEKINECKKELHDLASGIESEAKSSAGDKHEITRAMIQIEEKNIHSRLEDLHLLKAELTSLQMHIPSTIIRKGSFIKTNHGYFFIADLVGLLLIAGFHISASPFYPARRNGGEIPAKFRNWI